MINWAFAYISYQRGARLITEAVDDDSAQPTAGSDSLQPPATPSATAPKTQTTP
jgi:hypothetical protein